MPLRRWQLDRDLPVGLRGTRPSQESSFAIITQDKLLDTYNSIFGMFFLVMIALSAVGLIVGGVGVVAIMMISVTERTREIGVRKALGATRATILWQFLVEAAKYQVLPLDDRTVGRHATAESRPPHPMMGRKTLTLYPHMNGLVEKAAPTFFNRSYTLTASLDSVADGMLVSLGGRFGGFAAAPRPRIEEPAGAGAGGESFSFGTSKI